MNQEQIEGWFEETYAQLVKKERAYLAPQTKGSALKQVLAYVRQQGENWSTIKAAEVDVSLVKEGYILNGTMDLIGEKGMNWKLSTSNRRKSQTFRWKRSGWNNTAVNWRSMLIS